MLINRQSGVSLMSFRRLCKSEIFFCRIVLAESSWMEISSRRVMTVSNPIMRKIVSSFSAISRLIPFSTVPSFATVPPSTPPCPASIRIVGCPETPEAETDCSASWFFRSTIIAKIQNKIKTAATAAQISLFFFISDTPLAKLLFSRYMRENKDDVSKRF